MVGRGASEGEKKAVGLGLSKSLLMFTQGEETSPLQEAVH